MASVVGTLPMPLHWLQLDPIQFSFQPPNWSLPYTPTRPAAVQAPAARTAAPAVRNTAPAARTAAPAVRNAEKTRKHSTCAFSDRVTQSVLSALRQNCPFYEDRKQTGAPISDRARATGTEIHLQ